MACPALIRREIFRIVYLPLTTALVNGDCPVEWALPFQQLAETNQRLGAKNDQLQQEVAELKALVQQLLESK